MNPSILKELGLTSSQSKAYTALIEHGEKTPPELAKFIDETRSNTYMILARLSEIGLCEKVEHRGQLYYRANNPLALETLAEERKKRVSEVEMSVKHAMPTLLSYYYSFTERPGIRLLQGKEGLKEVYRDILRTKQRVLLVRTPADIEYLGEDYMRRYIQKRMSLGIVVEAITPDVPGANKRVELDEKQLFERHWVDPKDYDSPVEIAIYGNKVTFMAYGNDLMAVMIDNQLIAQSMRQFYELITKSLSNKALQN